MIIHVQTVIQAHGTCVPHVGRLRMTLNSLCSTLMAHKLASHIVTLDLQLMGILTYIVKHVMSHVQLVLIINKLVTFTSALIALLLTHSEDHNTTLAKKSALKLNSFHLQIFVHLVEVLVMDVLTTTKSVHHAIHGLILPSNLIHWLYLEMWKTSCTTFSAISVLKHARVLTLA